MLELVKHRCGIADNVHIYDADIEFYMKDCKADMKAAGVPEKIVDSGEHEGVLTALTLYVKAYLGSDRSDTEKYLDLYRKKVFRLTLEDENVE